MNNLALPQVSIRLEDIPDLAGGTAAPVSDVLSGEYFTFSMPILHLSGELALCNLQSDGTLVRGDPDGY